MDIVSVAFGLSYLIVLWLNTNAFVEYMTLFRLDGLFKIREYNKLQSEGYGGLYIEFLHEYYKDIFIVRLVSCPICLSFWLGLSITPFYDSYGLIVASPLVLFFYLVYNKMLQ